MTTVQFLWLGLTGVIFALWALHMFRYLFLLFAHARRRSGLLFPGPSTTLQSFADFLRDPEFRVPRTRLLVLTLAMLAASAANPLLFGPS